MTHDSVVLVQNVNLRGEERNAPLNRENLCAFRGPNFDVEGRHSLVIGEAKQLRKDAKVGLPTLKYFLFCGWIEDVEVI